MAQPSIRKNWKFAISLLYITYYFAEYFGVFFLYQLKLNQVYHLSLLFLILLFLVPRPRQFMLPLVILNLCPYIYHEFDQEDLYKPQESAESYKWTTWENLNASRGDMIEIRRGGALYEYLHWGIYDGDQSLIHLVNLRNGGGGRVKYELLEDVANGCELRVNNMEALARSKDLKRRSPTRVMEKALSMVTDEDESSPNSLATVEYNKFLENCEHFVTMCAYGVPFSFQSDSFYTYWSSRFIHQFVCLLLFYHILQISWIRMLLKVLVLCVLTESQCNRVNGFISEWAFALESSLGEIIPTLVFQRIFVYYPILFVVTIQKYFQ